MYRPSESDGNTILWKELSGITKKNRQLLQGSVSDLRKFWGWFTVIHLFAYINRLNVDTDKLVKYDEKPYTGSPFFDEVLQGSSFETKSTNYLSDVGLLAAIKYRLDEPC